MKRITIATEQKDRNDNYRSSRRDHVLEFMGNRYGLVFVPDGGEGRRVYQGPMVPGPWAQAFGLGVTISANREMSTGAEMRRNAAAGTEHVVAVGDQVVIEGVVFVVAAGVGYRKDYLRLELADEAAQHDEQRRHEEAGAADVAEDYPGQRISGPADDVKGGR